MDAERLGQPDRIVGRGAADVDVLAEDGELLGEVAVALVQASKRSPGQMRRSGQRWKGCVPPPQTAMLLRAQCSRSVSRRPARSAAMPVDGGPAAGC
jgi:hypothetical protein